MVKAYSEQYIIHQGHNYIHNCAPNRYPQRGNCSRIRRDQ